LDWNLKIGKEVEMKFLKCRKETRKKLWMRLQKILIYKFIWIYMKIFYSLHKLRFKNE
jgi:hypothetical protein